jgi:uncharacterized FlaG/YvyC family protein
MKSYFTVNMVGNVVERFQCKREECAKGIRCSYHEKFKIMPVKIQNRKTVGKHTGFSQQWL